MIWLLVSILTTTGLFLIFKAFHRHDIDTLPAIVVNYFTCFLCGNMVLGANNLFSAGASQQQWFPFATGMGLIFISVFYTTGTATRHIGASATTVASKMSVVIPAIASVLLFHEAMPAPELIGMGLSLVSVYFMAPSDDAGQLRRDHVLMYLSLVFLGSGMVDLGLNLLKHHFGSVVDDNSLSTTIFGSAGVIGLVAFLVTRRHHRFRWQELVGGMVLGLVNYLSLVALFRALDHFRNQTAWLFAVNNAGVVILSFLLSGLIFKESIHKRGYIGLALAVIAILLMNFHAVF